MAFGLQIQLSELFPLEEKKELRVVVGAVRFVQLQTWMLLLKVVEGALQEGDPSEQHQQLPVWEFFAVGGLERPRKASLSFW